MCYTQEDIKQFWKFVGSGVLKQIDNKTQNVYKNSTEEDLKKYLIKLYYGNNSY